ncbi:acyl-CoA dehydrogenase family protein [Rhodococcus koreensis]|uniref:acyl-CoA dehydrogenase family protein n=1 Tax=Rhodococcus koreensis TaxID=99653 RepID=UPI00366F5DED
MRQLSPVPTSLPSVYHSEERQAMLEVVRDLAMNQVLPLANKLDPVQGQIPDDLIETMADMGLFGILVDQEAGGLGLGVFEYCMVTEELARGWLSVGSLIARGNGVTKTFPAAQQRELLPKIAAGKWLGAFALSEPEAGSDVASIRTRAQRDGDEWVLTGQKMWCTFADRADFLVIVARTTPFDPARRNAGIRSFYVPKVRGQFPDGIVGTPMRKIGYHGWKTWELAIDGLRLPGSSMLVEDGADDQGFKAISQVLSTARVQTAARSIGLARGAVEDAIRYAQQRRQFDQPISDFQAIRFKIADMVSQVDTCRAMMYQVASDIDAGRPVDHQASMIKYLASEMSERVTSEALQIHGGAGYTTEFPVERYWRDARLTKIFEGTSEIQLRIVSDRFLPRPAKV